MSYYNDPSASWPASARQPSWEQPQPPSRSATGSTVNREDINAFAHQFDDIERAIVELTKSGLGKGFGIPPAYSRRDSLPVTGAAPAAGPRQYNDYDPRMAGPQRHHSLSEYDGMRPQSATNVQAYYQNQRYAPRSNDADQMQQAKRRMAAQRERELRNYHQEQQYHRNIAGSKSDRSMSPSANAMSEDDRRELIARQHRALYGDSSSLYTSNNPTSSQDVRVSGARRGPSPLAFDAYAMPAAHAPGEGSVQMPSRVDKDVTGSAQEARANGSSSPSTNQNPAFGLFDNAQQANHTSNSSPGASPSGQGSKSNGSGVAPIGTRPATNQGQPAGASLGKRATTPLPSPLSYNSYNASEHNNHATSSAPLSQSSTVTDNKGVSIWNKGPWGSNPTQGVQASVWG